MRDHKLDNRMESFFLAETIKYLYLLFDPDNFLHNNGSTFNLGGPDGDCVLGAGGYIFNTEAHPLDPAALHCCSRAQEERYELQDILLSLSEVPDAPSYPVNEEEEEEEEDEEEDEDEQLKMEGAVSRNMDPDRFLQASESIVLKPGSQRKARMLSCPMQPFSSRLALMGQVFTDST